VHGSPNTLIFGIHRGFYGAGLDTVSSIVQSLHLFVSCYCRVLLWCNFCHEHWLLWNG